MGWSGGTFSRFESTTGCADKAAAGTGITAVLEDQRFNEFATGINTCLTKDGQNTPTANLPMGTYKHTGVGAASATTDYARADQVQNSSLIWGGTTGGTTTAYTATLTPAPSAYVAGQEFNVIINAANTGTCSINFNSLGAKTITNSGAVALSAGELKSGYLYKMVYDGTYMRVISGGL